jgi:hypothetical protein
VGDGQGWQAVGWGPRWGTTHRSRPSTTPSQETKRERNPPRHLSTPRVHFALSPSVPSRTPRLWLPSSRTLRPLRRPSDSSGLPGSLPWRACRSVAFGPLSPLTHRTPRIRAAFHPGNSTTHRIHCSESGVLRAKNPRCNTPDRQQPRSLDLCGSTQRDSIPSPSTRCRSSVPVFQNGSCFAGTVRSTPVLGLRPS